MLSSLFQTLGMLLAGVAVLLIPGLAWQAWQRGESRDVLAVLAEAAALSLSVTAVGGLLAFLVGLQFSGGVVTTLYALLAALALVGWLWRSDPLARLAVPNSRVRRPDVQAWPLPPRSRQLIHPDRSDLLWIICGFLLTGAFLAWRLYQARSLALPAWVDSVHHTLLVRIFLENGGLVSNLEPYIQAPLYYHYAFHAATAVYAALSGLAPEKAVLFFGQAINAAVGLSVYHLGREIWKHIPDQQLQSCKSASQPCAPALVAALLVTFFSQMPAYYLTWGRYTLLTGLVVLPVAMSAALEAVRSPFRWERLARLAVLTAGVLLAHYLAGILLALWLLVLAALRLAANLRTRSFQSGAWITWVAGAGLGMLAASPWLWRIWIYSRTSFNLTFNLTTSAPDQTYFPNYLNYLKYLSGPQRNYVLIVLGLFGLVLALWRGRARALAIWSLVIFTFTIPWGLRLGPFRPDHMAIVWFIPVTLLASHLIVSLSNWANRAVAILAVLRRSAQSSRQEGMDSNPIAVNKINRERAGRYASNEVGSESLLMVAPARGEVFDDQADQAPLWKDQQSSRVVPILVGIAVLATLIWGMRDTRNILNLATVFANQDDVAALQWVQANTSPQASFWINTTPWQDLVYRGVDGGWWIQPVTGRSTLLPPVLYMNGRQDAIQKITTMAEQASQVRTCEELSAQVSQEGLDYVYLHQGAGNLQPEAMQNCAGFKPVYNLGGVSIYQSTGK